MLRGIHKASSTWLGKGIMAVIMGGLAISFAIWGIGDIFRGTGARSVAKVGGTEIGIEQFRVYYNEQIRQLGQRMGRFITPDQARAAGLDRQLLVRIVAETALDEQVRNLRLGISNEEIARRIAADPTFLGAGGQFDRVRFNLYLSNTNTTEGRFVEDRRRLTLRRQIAQSVGGELKVPTTTLDAINRFQNETRTIEFVSLTAAQAGDIPKPTAEMLAKYFEERKVLFRAPEYRKVTLLVLSPADLAQADKVSDADAKLVYDTNKGAFGKPEKRALRQIVFPNADDATAASARLAKGLSFADLIKERGLKDSDTDLGVVAKSEIIDPAVADAAFALKAGSASAPVKGRFGTVILQVTKIEPGEEKTYEQVAPQIKKEIAENRAKRDIGAQRDKIEDERAAGSTLAETAKKLGLTARTIDATDRSGRAPDGTQIANLPQGADVITAAFSTDVGVDTDPMQLPTGGLVWYDVSNIMPAHDRALDEIKDQVETRWRNDEIAKRLQAKADDMLGKLKAGTPLAQVASENRLTVDKASGLQRNKPAAKIPAKALDAVFRTAKDAAGSAEGATQNERVVFRVMETNQPKLDPASEAAKATTTALSSSYTDDINGQYIARLENEFGVTVNPAGVTQALGGGTVPDDNN